MLIPDETCVSDSACAGNGSYACAEPASTGHIARLLQRLKNGITLKKRQKNKKRELAVAATPLRPALGRPPNTIRKSERLENAAHPRPGPSNESGQRITFTLPPSVQEQMVTCAITEARDFRDEIKINLEIKIKPIN
ncbi:uncharacterized protein LOC112576448 [Pomacea canaliculata]|uniref:uncharacterized protein LOC112576448 n=1 Tax=Pomacea canaliculata TaxID=400727 RepID=UPI000D729F30|nr:uncharacterized protein LOC112576448 [Pomacea canaliculata]